MAATKRANASFINEMPPDSEKLAVKDLSFNFTKLDLEDELNDDPANLSFGKSFAQDVEEELVHPDEDKHVPGTKRMQRDSFKSD